MVSSENFFGTQGAISPIASQKSLTWLRSFAKTDPRWEIMRFLQNYIVQLETKHLPAEASKYEDKGKISTNRPGVFSVWRATNMDAVRLMMTGKGTGKGLDVKGKSAIKGKFSGFVPFVQIHNNDEHKKKVGTSPPNTRVRIFFSTEGARDVASVQLKKIMLDMIKGYKLAEERVESPCSEMLQYEDALQKMIWKMTNPKVIKIDDYAPKSWGVDIPERLLWEAYIVRGNCTREPGSEMDTGRPSEPQFFFMNLHSTRNQEKSPRAVVWQNDLDNPMDPMSLLMAYEEDGHVIPVVSDFDPFLIGTRGVPYDKPLESDQVEILQWCVNEIEGILNTPEVKGGWTRRWLRVMKKAARRGFHPTVPPYGFGDPLSYSIMKNVVGSLKRSGAVRHGAECFNYYFPQVIDEEFLIIYPDYFGKIPYKYVNQYELKQFLIKQVSLGFTFPLNPKWILCDSGWVDVWNALLSNNNPRVKESLDIWYPAESGIREKINEIVVKYPKGFIEIHDGLSTCITSVEETDLAKIELKRYMTLQRAKRKLRIVTSWMRFSKSFDERSNDDEKESSETEFNNLEEATTTSKDDFFASANQPNQSEFFSIEQLNEKNNEIRMKEQTLNALREEVSSKLQLLENQEGSLKMLKDIRARERQLELKESELKARESRIEKLQLETNAKLQEMISQGKGNHYSMFESITLEFKEIEVWRKESELQLQHIELQIRAEKIKARENEIATKELNFQKKKNIGIGVVHE